MVSGNILCERVFLSQSAHFMTESPDTTVERVCWFMGQVGQARQRDGVINGIMLARYLREIGVTGPASARALLQELFIHPVPQRVKEHADSIHPHITGRMTPEEIIAVVWNIIGLVYPFPGWERRDVALPGGYANQKIINVPVASAENDQ